MPDIYQMERERDRTQSTITQEERELASLEDELRRTESDKRQAEVELQRAASSVHTKPLEPVIKPLPAKQQVSK